MTTPAPWSAHLPDGVRAESLDLLRGESLPRVWQSRWIIRPDIPTIVTPAGVHISAGELDELSARIAGRLAQAGLRPGDRILLSAQTSVELVAAHIAALRVGLVVVPVNVAYRQRELEYIVRDCAPRAAIVDEDDRAGWLREANSDLLVLDPGVSFPDGHVPVLDGTRRNDPALICYTSGTTGSPKGAVLTHGNLLAGAEAVALAWRWTDADRLLLALPLFHVHGICVGLHGTLLVGGSAILHRRFDVDAVLDSVSRDEGTLFFGVPTMYSRLAESPRLAELGKLRLCVSGSAALPPTVFSRIAERSGHQILERYGMTETLMNISNPYEGERRPGTVGFPLPGVEVRLENGQEGEILLRGPNVFPGYWGNAEATAEAFDDGWFRSGDLGLVDGDNYISIVGRIKELIISGGLNVYPREVEDVLLEHPSIAEAAVVGTPSEEWGQIVTAFIVSRSEGLGVEEVKAFASDRLANYKQPRIVRFVESLPRNALGKVMKHQLVGQP